MWLAWRSLSEVASEALGEEDVAGQRLLVPACEENGHGGAAEGEAHAIVPIPLEEPLLVA